MISAFRVLSRPWIILVFGAISTWGLSIIFPTWTSIVAGVLFLLLALAASMIPASFRDRTIAFSPKNEYGLIIHSRNSRRGKRRIEWTFKDWCGLIVLVVVLYCIGTGVNPLQLANVVLGALGSSH